MNNPMQRYVATRSFTMGSDGVNIVEGSDIGFDGCNMTYNDLPMKSVPQLRGAVRMGWLVPIESYDADTNYQKRISANIAIRPADGGNPALPVTRNVVSAYVHTDEQEVARVSEHASETRIRNRDYKISSRYIPSVGVQEEIEIPFNFKTVAGEKSKRTTTDVNRCGEVVAKVSNITIEPGRGLTRDEKIRQLIENGASEEDIEKYKSEIELNKGKYVSEGFIASTQKEQVSVSKLNARRAYVESTVVSRVPVKGKVHKEGFDISNSVGGGVSVEDLGGGVSSSEETAVEIEGIVFRNTNGPKKNYQLVDKQTVPSQPHGRHAGRILTDSTQPGSADDSVCRKIAKSICPDFPDNYIFTDPIRKKIARVQADYEDRHDVIRAIAAAETDMEVKRCLITEFPLAFT